MVISTDKTIIDIRSAERADAESILNLQKLAYQSEAMLYNDWSLPPLTQSLESLLQEFSKATVLKAMLGSRIVGSVRAESSGNVCTIGRLVVHPDLQRKGLGSRLLSTIEAQFPTVASYKLFTGSKSAGNIRLYQRHGYHVIGYQPLSAALALTHMEKPASSLR